MTALLAVDVGNTNTVIGLYDGDSLKHHFRISTNRSATADEIGELISSLVERRGIDPRSIDGTVRRCSSVDFLPGECCWIPTLVVHH
jgi:type III pantothenate kinase